jgi:glycosyltransferase involved in cell wall biosynthesis
MRIGFDTSPLTARRSGIGNYAANLLREIVPLLNEGDRISGLSVGRSAPDYEALGFTLDSRHVPIPARVMYRIWGMLNWPSVDGLLGDVDVYHATNFFLPPVRNARRIVSIPDASFAVVPELCSPKIVGPFSASVARFAREADVVLTISEASKRDIVEQFGADGEKVRVTYPGPGVMLHQEQRDESQEKLEATFGIKGPFALFVSTLEPRKNIPGLVKAFDRVAEDLPHSLVLAGQLGWNTGPIVDAINSAQHTDRIHRLGFVQDNDLASLYAAADAFVFPSFYEGFGLPVLEAMRAGCPVITTNNSALPEVGGDAAAYVDAHDVEALAETMIRVLSDETEREAMADRGRAQAAQFTWRNCADATLAAYRG